MSHCWTVLPQEAKSSCRETEWASAEIGTWEAPFARGSQLSYSGSWLLCSVCSTVGGETAVFQTRIWPQHSPSTASSLALKSSCREGTG